MAAYIQRRARPSRSLTNCFTSAERVALVRDEELDASSVDLRGDILLLGISTSSWLSVSCLFSVKVIVLLKQHIYACQHACMLGSILPSGTTRSLCMACS
jgi:hypothetical protein